MTTRGGDGGLREAWAYLRFIWAIVRECFTFPGGTSTVHLDHATGQITVDRREGDA